MKTIKNMKSKVALMVCTVLSLGAANMHAMDVAKPITTALQDSAWRAVGSNMKIIATNIWEAAKLVGSFVPGALKQFTHETGLITGAVKKCPIISAALVTFAAYKAYTWYYADAGQANNRHNRQ